MTEVQVEVKCRLPAHQCSTGVPLSPLVALAFWGSLSLCQAFGSVVLIQARGDDRDSRSVV